MKNNIIDSMIIREITEVDLTFLDDFLHLAIYTTENDPPVPKSIIYIPEIYIYIKEFGSKNGDHGVVAEFDGKLVCMSWTRIIPAYGYIENNIPELVISVLPEYKGKGVGTMVMQKLFELLKTNGYNQTSLSVQKDNPAVEFYKKLGYIVYSERLDNAKHEDYLMIKEF